MASKDVRSQSTGAHTAGIYADMTVDGPEIGTLVAVVDRAKNLPNRKTMGKQDPYCAMRLGKEAKKTETDKRGGQTPRWDQELRFTVHESPDYYKLKVSVFNDDKKTDLIGEAWVDLRPVVIPGGGQNDLWHGLQYKGKYAGDIRVELTYYDTRPKDESVVEKRRGSEKNDIQQPASSGMTGPRQPKPMKRRPLPADPTGALPVRPTMPEQTQSSPIPHSARDYDQHDDFNDSWGPDQQYHNGADPSFPAYDSFQQQQQPFHQGYQHDPYSQRPFPDRMAGRDLPDAPSEYDEYEQPNHLPESDDYVQYGNRNGYSTPPAQMPYHTPPRDERRHSAQPSFPPQSRISPNNVPSQYGSSPPTQQPLRSPPASAEPQRMQFNRFSTSPTKRDVFRDSPLRQSMSHAELDHDYDDMHGTMADDAPPPPPPVHRSSVPGVSSHTQPVGDMQPSPLNIGSGHGPSTVSPNDRSPLQQIEREYESYVQSNNMASPTERTPHAAMAGTSYTSYGHRSRGRSQDSYGNSPGASVPPSLVAGYDPSIADAESERNLYANRGQIRSDISQAASPRGVMPYSPISPSPFSSSPSPVDERQAYRAPVPNSKTRAISPDVRGVPSRNSVSPRPVQRPEDERRLSGVPFGPDSYDALNPSIGSAEFSQPSSTYQTPAQANEAARQREVEKLRVQGPIIGNDGREIDPSDHLPRDTWAPEYEKKPAKKPEVVIKFKHAGPTAQPRTPASVPAIRPHSISNPVYGAYSSPAVPQVTDATQSRTGRNRLQKPNAVRPLPTQPFAHPQHEQQLPQTHSSPVVPTLHNQSPVSPPSRPNYSQPPPRHSVSGYPLRETMDYGNRSYGSSPRGSPYGSTNGMTASPPVPAKVPIHAGNQNWSGGMDALSAELSTIDIGSGVNGRRGYEQRGWGVR